MTERPVPLYSETAHSLARAFAGCIAVFLTVGLVLGARDLLSRPTPVSMAALAGFVVFTLAVLRMLTRAERLFGTPEGLVSKAGKVTRTFPWSKVGHVERPISAMNPVFRRHYITVVGEKKRIYFFAGRPEIERLEALRTRWAE